MKRITLLAAACAVLFSSAVFGQAPGAKPAPAPAMKAEKATAQPAPPKLAQATTGRRSRATEDARSCLQQATNTEIAKCAEQYR